MREHYHHGITIREHRQKRGMTQLELAEQWPTGPVNLRYIQYIEKGDKQIVDQHILRQLSDLLDIPLWRFGLSPYNPFHPESLPGHGERMHQETLDVAESLIQQTWRLRQIAPLPEAERSALHFSNLFDYFLTYLPPRHSWNRVFYDCKPKCNVSWESCTSSASTMMKPCKALPR